MTGTWAIVPEGTMKSARRWSSSRRKWVAAAPMRRGVMAAWWSRVQMEATQPAP